MEHDMRVEVLETGLSAIADELAKLRDALAQPMDMVQVGGTTIVDRKARMTYQYFEKEQVLRGWAWGDRSDEGATIRFDGEEGSRYWTWLCDHSDKAV